MSLKETLRNAVRVVLKHTLNPLTRRLAKSSFGPFALVRHVGRRSGKPYETPIIVAPIGDDLVIELTYGPDVDWFKNVRAAGGCTVLRHKRVYQVSRIEPVDAETGRAAFPLPAQIILRGLGRTHFFRFVTARPT